jgi:DNA-binding transcriptional ArsR family regulator
MSKRRKTGGGLAELLSPRFFKALCDPNRLSLLVNLARCDRACTVTEIASTASIDLSVVSRHLATLRDAGILESGRRGKEVLYRLRGPALVENLRAIADAIEACCGDGKTPEESS